ncbi:hypothetical protein MC885_012758 [Smutsia gigantea]|nr:hypothetical protein MC885_012758 [Smutsia gigantea]
MERLLREGHSTQCLRLSALDFQEAITQYLTAKVLGLACNEAQNYSRRCITLELMDMAVPTTHCSAASLG